MVAPAPISLAKSLALVISLLLVSSSFMLLSMTVSSSITHHINPSDPEIPTLCLTLSFFIILSVISYPRYGRFLLKYDLYLNISHHISSNYNINCICTI